MFSNKPDMPGQPKENPGKLKQWQTVSKILNMEWTLTNVLHTPKHRRKTHNGAIDAIFNAKCPILPSLQEPPSRTRSLIHSFLFTFATFPSFKCLRAHIV